MSGGLPGITHPNWGALESAECPGAMHEYAQTRFGATELGPSPLFNFNPEQTGSIDTSLPGYSFTRATTATTISRSGSVYTIESVATGTPRYVDHPTLGAGYWCESASTNVCLQSEDLGTTWSSTRTSIGGSITAPDGTTSTTAGAIADATSNTHFTQQAITYSAGQYTFSGWAKAGDLDWIRVAITETTSRLMYFNVSTGEKGTNTGFESTTIEDWGNGWYRWSVTETVGAGSGTIQVQPAEADGDVVFAGDASTVNSYFWGMQLETGSFASSYIPTTTTSVTRNADDLRYEHPLSSGAAGSLVIAVTRSDYTESGLAFLGHIGDTAAERIRVLLATTNRVSTTGSASSSTVWSLNSSNNSMVDGTRHVFALSWDTNDVEAFLDGASFGTDTSSSNPSMSNKVFIGAERTGINQLNGVVHLTKLYDVTGIDGSAE